MEVGATAAAAPLVSSSVADFPLSVDASWGGSLEEGTVEEVAGGGQGVTEGGRGGGGGGEVKRGCGGEAAPTLRSVKIKWEGGRCTVISTLWREMETCLLNGKSFPKRCSTGDIIMAIVTSR